MSARAAALFFAVVAGCGDSDHRPGAPGATSPSPDAGTGPSSEVRVVINEFMAGNVLTAAADWVELHNAGDTAVALDGWGLTDDEAVPAKQRLDGRVLPPGGQLLVLLDFALRREGGTLSLARPEGGFADRLRYGEQAVDLSAARVPDAGGRWVVRWRVTPGAANGPGEHVEPAADPEEVPAAGDVSERLLGEDAFPAFELEIPRASEASLRTNPRTWTRATLVYEGRRHGPVAVRLKGQNSFRPYDEKPSFKVKIDHYVDGAELLGMDELTLNNMHNDPSMLADPLSYWVARAAGVPASRATHATLRVNGAPYGLYALVETVKPRFIRRWFDDASGPLFEGAEVDFTPEQVAGFEHEGGPDDRTALAGLAEALLHHKPADALAAAEPYVDLAQFRRYWAAMAVVGQYDGFPFSLDDYHVYAEPPADRLVFIPWGMDETYERYWRDPDDVVGKLAIACEEVRFCRDRFVAEVWDVVDLTERLGLLARIDELTERTHEAALHDPRKAYTDAEVVDARDGVREFVRRRRADLTEHLRTPRARPPAP